MKPSSTIQRVLPARQRWALHGLDASRAIEAAELARHPPGTLMQRAALGVARLARALAPQAEHIWIAAGPGGNGGDGLHAAAELQLSGAQVHVTLLADVAGLAPDAAAGRQRALAAGARVDDQWPAAGAGLAIDALLGLGAARPAAGRMAEAIERLNRHPAPVLAIDLPSGLSADTGQASGPAVGADATLALLTLKPGLFTGAGRDHAGELWFDDLGLGPVAIDPTAYLSGSDCLGAAWPSRRHGQHKGDFGDVVVVGGAPGMPGALHLAAHGALAAGAGRTAVCPLDSGPAAGVAARPEWMWLTADALQRGHRLDRSTIVAGCGGGAAIASVLPVLIAGSERLLLDADALNAIAADPMLAAQLEARGRRTTATVLTPHPLEAARLLSSSTAAVQADRLAAAQTIAGRFGAVVVLKGSGSIVAGPHALPCINSTGNARLAIGGSGDVLAGWIGGAWAAGGDAFEVAAASAWLHGAAADVDEDMDLPLRPLDLVEAMRRLAGAALLTG